MKILFVIDTLGSGGTQRRLINLANGLCDRHNISIFLYNSQSNFFLKLISKQISIINSKRSKKKGFDIIVLKILRKYIKKNDVVVSFGLTANIYCALANMIFSRTRHIACEVSIIRDDESVFKRIIGNLANYLAHHVICNTYAQANYIRTFPRMIKKVSTIWNGSVQYDYVQRTCNNKKNYFFLVVARIAYPKNGLRLLQALNIFYERNKFIPHVIWAGRDDTSSKLSILMKHQMISFLNDHPKISNKFSFIGEQINTYSLYSSADALLLTSIYEGLPNVMCEAMFSGCPVIVSKIADNEKIIGRNEKLGFLCNPFSPLDICLAMERRMRVSDQGLRAMTRNARAFADKHFLISKMVDQYEKIIKKICNYD